MPRETDFKQTLCADIDGFSLHAAVRCEADDLGRQPRPVAQRLAQGDATEADQRRHPRRGQCRRAAAGRTGRASQPATAACPRLAAVQAAPARRASGDTPAALQAASASTPSRIIGAGSGRKLGALVVVRLFGPTKGWAAWATRWWRWRWRCAPVPPASRSRLRCMSPGWPWRRHCARTCGVSRRERRCRRASRAGWPSPPAESMKACTPSSAACSAPLSPTAAPAAMHCSWRWPRSPGPWSAAADHHASTAGRSGSRSSSES